MQNTTRTYQTGFLRRYITLASLIILGYLLQVTVIPYIRPFGVTPNLLYVIIGIVTVAYGKLRAFWAGLCFGLLMEIMLPSVTFLNLALYPVTTLFCSFAFADKPIKTIEYERATNKNRRESPAWLRTVLCTGLNVLIFELVNVTYIYLSGTGVSLMHILKALGCILLSCALCFVLLFPLRRLILGRKTDVLVLKNAPAAFH